MCDTVDGSSVASHMRKTGKDQASSSSAKPKRSALASNDGSASGVFAEGAGNQSASVPASASAAPGRHARGATAGRHARSAAAVEHGSSASVTGAFQRLDPSVTGSFAVIADAELRPISTPASTQSDAPSPINASPEVTGSFERITPEMLAQVSSDSTYDSDAAQAARSQGSTIRANSHRLPTSTQMSVSAHSRHESPAMNKRAIAGVALAAVVVIGLVGVFLQRMATGISNVANSNPEITQVDPSDSIVVAGTAYTLEESGEGPRVLYARSESGSAVAVATINGDPAQILTYNGSIIVPESFADGTWDIIAYTPGGDAIATQVVGEDGVPVHGVGAISEARLDGSSLVIVDTSGATTTVSLGSA